MKARRLKALCAVINQSSKFEARIERSFCNTDWKPRGFRYIVRKGKGRWGNKLIVCPVGDFWHPVFTHDAAETYRCNKEVEEWIKEHLPKKFWHEDFKCPKGKETQ